MVVLHGSGGIGKTQIVLQYAYTHQNEYSCLFWVNGQSIDTTRNSFLQFGQRLLDSYAQKSSTVHPNYSKIAQHLGMAGLVDGDGQIYLNQKSVDLIVEAIKGWLSRRGNDHWLVVLDNVDDLESFRISDFFPANITGKIILTTRHDEKVAAGKVILTTRRSDLMSWRKTRALNSFSSAAESKERVQHLRVSKYSHVFDCQD
jgi:hypothetical protein